MCRIPTIKFTKHMKLKKKEDQSMDVSVLLRRENKIIITGGRGWEGLRRKRAPEEGKKWWQDPVWDETGEMYRGSEN